MAELFMHAFAVIGAIGVIAAFVYGIIVVIALSQLS
jgi:hypothetical protein